MTEIEWNSLTKCIDVLTECETEIITNYQEIIDSLKLSGKELIINNPILGEQNIVQMIENMRKNLLDYIGEVKNYFEIILNDLAKNKYDLDNPLICAATIQSISFLKTKIANNYSMISAAVSIILSPKISSEKFNLN